jgi:hypothetical protein
MKVSNLVPVGVAIACAACSQAPSEEAEFGRVSLNLTIGNNDSSGASSTRAKGPDGGSGVVDAEGSLNAQTALAFVRHVEFYKMNPACEGGSDGGTECDEKVRIDGPWVVNLITGEATPSVENIEIPAGAYRRIDVRFEDADKNAAKGLSVPDELSGWSLIASGEYSGTSASQFDMRLKFNQDARFTSESGIIVGPNATQEMFMALDVQRWFSVVSLEDCLAKERLDVVDDVLVIEDASRRCNAVENAIKEVMKHPNRLED